MSPNNTSLSGVAKLRGSAINCQRGRVFRYGVYSFPLFQTGSFEIHLDSRDFDALQTRTSSRRQTHLPSYLEESCPCFDSSTYPVI